MTDTPIFDDDDPFALRDTIAPGTAGDPNDTMDDLPLIRDADEPKRPPNDADDQNGHDEEGAGFFDQHPPAGDKTVLAVDEREDDQRHKRKYIVPGRFKDGSTHLNNDEE